MHSIAGTTEHAGHASRNGDRGVALQLAAIAGLLLVIYAGFCLFVPLTPGRLERASASLITELPLWRSVSALRLPLLHDVGAFAPVFLFSLAVVPLLYGLAIALSWGRSPGRATVTTVLAGAAAFFAVSLLALPNQTTDIYNYISRARVAAVHDSNPHYVPASRFPEDPLYAYASPRIARITGDKLALWTLISTGTAKLAGHGALANLFAMRLLFFACNLANLALIALVLHKLVPRHVLAGIILYGWNPVVAVLGQSKTDTVMMTFMLLAVLLLILDRRRWAIVSMGLSVLIKFMTLPIIAVYWLRDLRLKRWRELAVNAVILCLLVVALYAPYWEGPQLIVSHMKVVFGEAGASAGGMRSILIAGFLLLVAAVGLTRDTTHASLISGWAWVMLFVAVFLARTSNSWYLITAIGMASLCSSPGVALLAVIASCAAFAFSMWYTTSTGVFPLPDVFSASRRMVFLAPIALGAIGIAAAALLARRRHASAQSALKGR